ncbi:MAG: hypothetical protein ACSHXI_07200 [Hoeflea sp.]|uniref:hypothetical protein n=1 Tax=Hoeflea sp. TaxID=1940281 RepID=UPI003EF3299B
MSKKLFVPLAAFVFLSGQSFAQAPDCDNVYRSNVRNISTNSEHTYEKAYYFSLYCEKSGETKDIVTSANFSFPIEGVPLDVSGDGNFSETELKEFCKVGQQENTFRNSFQNRESTVVVEALESYNNCVALLKRDVFISHEENRPNGVTIDVQLTNPDLSLTVHGMSGVGKGVSCTSTGLSRGSGAVEVTAEKEFEVKNREFSIICERTPLRSGESIYYPPAEITLSTSAGSYPIKLREDTLLGFQLGSEAKQAHDALLMENANLRREFDNVRQESDYRQRRLGGLELKVLYQGDNAIPNDVKFTCPQLGGPTLTDAHFAQACSPGNTMIFWKQTQSASGGHCGHTTYAVLCSVP